MTPPVSDAGPVISFARVNRLGLLQAIIPRLIIPQAVYNEIVVEDGGRPGAAEVRAGEWIELQPLSDHRILARVSPALHAGERECIALALELGRAVLMDERRGRREADRLGVPTLSTLVVLRFAKERGHIPAVRPLLDQLRADDFRLKQALYEAYLSDLEE